MRRLVLMSALAASLTLSGAGMAAPDNAERVAAGIRAQKEAYPLANAPLTWYAVPAMSSVKRLPDTFPEDGTLCGPLQIVAARSEFEPASFVVYSFKDVDRAELRASALTAREATIPAANVDLKVVKCWYQTGTAWHSYFADATGRCMTPELLLNDENLIKVDTATQDNYLRADYPEGTKYLWISFPASVKTPFNAETTPVADAKTLQPFRLEAGRFKQFWVTVKVPGNAAPGVYRGRIDILCGGAAVASVPLSLRVLPFDLPKPMTYYDMSREFYTLLYNEPHYSDILKLSGGDAAHADRKMLAMYENMRDHGIVNPQVANLRGDRDAFIRQLKIFRQAGLSTDPLFSGVPAIPSYGWMTSPQVKGVPIRDQPDPEDLYQRVDEAAKIVKEMFGHTNVYCFGWDEPGISLLIAERKPWKYIHDRGLMIYTTGHDTHFKRNGYNEDFCNSAGAATREKAAKWHAIGARVTNYADPHTGPENPDFMRRVHGMILYKANYDGMGNYIVSCSRWNDFIGTEYNFRSFNLTYPTRDGVVDTLAWEGTREAVDDVRYATKLKTLALAAIATGKTESVYAGRKALQWIENADEKRADLNGMRMEMIQYIMKLMEMQQGGAR